MNALYKLFIACIALSFSNAAFSQTASTSSIDAKGRVVVNGALFFPIGFYGLNWNRPFQERIEALELIAGNGFNTIFAEDIATSNFGELLDTAARLNVKVIVGSSSLPDNQYIRATVNQYKNKSAVLAWSLFDDSDDGQVSIDAVRTRNALVKSLDANHFTLASLTGYYQIRRDQKAEYVQVADASGMQMYPITPFADYSFEYGGNPLTESYRRTLAYVSAAEQNGKALIVNAQTFSWPGEARRYPTVIELRNMFYGQLMAGAKGIVSYDYSPDLFDNQRPLFNEYVALKNDVLNVLKAPLLEGAITRSTQANGEIHTTTWEHNNALYVSVLNTSLTQAYPVSLAIPTRFSGAVVAPIARLGANLQLTNNTLAGSLPAMGVEVYKIAASDAPAGTRTIAYTGDTSNFPNPERGFAYENDVEWPEGGVRWDFCGQGNNFTAYDYTKWNTPLSVAFMQQERALGRSVISARYHIADFRNRPFTPEYLAFLQSDFDSARTAGMKLHLRYAYNYPWGGPDAPLAQILQHLDQLKPLFQRNRDVIAYMDASFVGCWGEWHDSSNGLAYPNDGLGGPTDGRIHPAQVQIIDKILEVLPKERMMALRYPRHKFDYFGNADLSPIAPLTASEAYTGSSRARIGFEDDCFVCNATHGGGYWNPRGDFSEAPNFLKKENRYVVQGGEPGPPDSTTIDPSNPGTALTPISSCEVVGQEFSEKQWSVVGLFDIFNPISAYGRWARDGCLETFSQRLGYRFRLVSATVPTSAQIGRGLSVSLTMTNDGYARPYNPRGVELVLRNKATQAITRLTTNNAQDARLWLPGPAETKTLLMGVRLPGTLVAGEYDVLFNLPDPEPSLNQRAEYSIRLANTDVWESATGYNALGASITIRR
jgi:Domain of unknown function (DUF4832)/Domain of unknown function (DUF4874)